MVSYLDHKVQIDDTCNLCIRIYESTLHAVHDQYLI